MSTETAPSPRHMKLRANGLTHHVVMTGEGPPILLVHGWLGSSYHWRHLMPLLAASHTVIAVDVRGYGDSDKPALGYDGETIAADLRGIAQALGLSRYIVLGHDMGALPALLLAAGHPDEVSGLIYVDEPLPGYNLDQFTAFRRDNPFVYWWFSFNAQPHLPALMWAGKEAELVDYFLTAMCADPTTHTAADKAEYVRGLRKPGGLDGSFGWYRDALVTADQIRAATTTRIKTPVLAINGAYGHPGVGEQMGLVAETVTSVTLPFCGHLCAEEKPAEMAAAILAFTATLR
ncbi:MAG: alpha/beta fold hydrolase [Labrys sp. (in: a-proteobacteria)]